MADPSTTTSVTMVLTSAVIAAVVSSILGPLLFHVLNKRQQRQTMLLERRYDAYTRYLGTVEHISESLRAEVFEVLNHRVPALFQQAAEEQKTLQEFMAELSACLARVTNTCAQAKGELYGLQLVASEEVLAHVLRYIALNDALLKMVTTRLSEMGTRPGLSSEVEAAGHDLDAIHAAMVKRMRQELGAA